MTAAELHTRQTEYSTLKIEGLFLMVNSIKILNVQQDGDDGVIVMFSDGSMAGYVVEELLALRPYREPSVTPPPEEQS